MEYEITLDIHSGLPNPAWRLNSNDAERLQKWLKSLPKRVVTHATEPPPLGYRGVSIRRTDDPACRSQMHVFEESVLADSDTFLDSGRQLEEWLLTSGKPHVSGPIWDYAIQAVRAKRA